MFHSDLYVAERTMDMHVEEALRRAESRRLLHQTGIDQRGWLSQQSSWLLCQLGRSLVVLGQRLERCGQLRAIRLEGQTSGGVLSGDGG